LFPAKIPAPYPPKKTEESWTCQLAVFLVSPMSALWILPQVPAPKKDAPNSLELDTDMLKASVRLVSRWTDSTAHVAVESDLHAQGNQLNMQNLQGMGSWMANWWRDGSGNLPDNIIVTK
jgi:hypothetical protein